VIKKHGKASHPSREGNKAVKKYSEMKWLCDHRYFGLRILLFMKLKEKFDRIRKPRREVK
jgi:hypothetical protein